MATINSVPKSIHLPLTSLSSPRVLMCSASVGTEGSVTLQLRDSSDSNQSPTQTSLENALTIGYPDPEMLADVFGSLQTASFKNHSSALVSASPTTTTTITAAAIKTRKSTTTPTVKAFQLLNTADNNTTKAKALKAVSSNSSSSILTGSVWSFVVILNCF
uniref:Uncharacterized protein n=1 Tax=Ceratitis capitata TaxID=7213 RepID=W8ANR1_CERCA